MAVLDQTAYQQRDIIIVWVMAGDVAAMAAASFLIQICAAVFLGAYALARAMRERAAPSKITRPNVIAQNAVPGVGDGQRRTSER